MQCIAAMQRCSSGTGTAHQASAAAGAAARALQAVTVPLKHLAVRRVVCQYRGVDRSDHRDEGWTVWTSNDPINGALSPESHAVLLALLEKQVEFKQVKARAQANSSISGHTRCVLSRQQAIPASLDLHIHTPCGHVIPTQVDMSAKPQEFIELYHSIIPDKDVRERVPVLVHGPKRLVDHNTIVEYLATAYPDSGTPLTPPDPYAAARVRLFTQYFADHVVPAYQHLIHAVEPHVVEAKESLMKALAAVDEFLGLHGAGEGEYAVGPHYGWSMTSVEQVPKLDGSCPHEHYLMGPFYTTAEVLCTPYVARMVHTLPEWRGMDVLAECEAQKLGRVAGWMRACLARPSAQLTGPDRKELVNGLVEWEWSHAV